MRAYLFPLLPLVLAACGATASETSDADNTSAISTPTPNQIAAAIDIGQTVHVDYNGSSEFRALRYEGRRGDHLDIHVTGTSDAFLWLVAEGNAVWAGPTRNALSFDIPQTDVYFIVLRNPMLLAAKYDVTLGGAHVSTPIFDVTEWAKDGIYPLPLRCTTNGVAFDVPAQLEASRRGASGRRIIDVYPGHPESSGIEELQVGAKLLSNSSTGDVSSVSLLALADSWNKAPLDGETLLITEETAQTETVIGQLNGMTIVQAKVENLFGAIRIGLSRAAGGNPQHPTWAVDCTGIVASPHTHD